MDLIITPILNDCEVSLSLAVYDLLSNVTTSVDIFGNDMVDPGASNPAAFTVTGLDYIRLDKDNQEIESGSIAIENPAVTNLSLKPQDGHTQYNITVQSGDESITSKYQVFLKCGLDECFSALEDKYKFSCGSDDDLLKYMKVKTSKEVIEALISEGKHNQATCLLNGADAMCTDVENCITC